MVYSVPCNECLQAYFGQTGRLLDHHIPERRQAVWNGDVVASAMAEHVFTAGHKVDLLRQQTVIDAHPYAQTRYLLESWHIQHKQTPPTGNIARTLCHPAGLTFSCVSIILYGTKFSRTTIFADWLPTSFHGLQLLYSLIFIR